MNFDPVLLAPKMAPMKAAGFWRDETVNHFFEQALANCPDKTAVVEYRQGNSQPRRMSYRELDAKVERIARGLVAMGVGHADVVSYQLPNCWEFVAITLACARIGAVANPVMPIFRERELSFMLNFGESKVFIVPKSFRGFDYEKMARGMQAGLPHLEHLVIVGGASPDSFEHTLLRDDTPALDVSPIGPDDVLLLMYTSGTTGEPKGVMHTSNTLFANLHAFISVMELSASDIVLGASPMAHLTGYGYLVMVPMLLNSTTVLQDIWDAKRALEIARAENVTFSMASSAFVADLCLAVENGAEPAPTFTRFSCAGAPIPPVLIDRAFKCLNTRVSSAWGMTECGAVTITEPGRALEKSGVSDGKVVPGIELKIVDAMGHELPAGETGSLLIRGASLFGGYLKRPELNGTTDDGWFSTGDMAFLDEEGYLRINGRSKDLIIRGGENIPVTEVENLLYKHPAVMTCAVVAYPDKRLGERACAFVTLKPGTRLTLDDVVSHFSAQKVARQFIPERLEIIDDMPSTPSGKVQKFKLRQIAQQFGDGTLT